MAERTTVKKAKRVVAAKVSRKAVDPNSKEAQAVGSFFDSFMRKEWNTFLQERAKVIDISNAPSAKKKIVKGKKRGPYKQEGVESISFKELTSYNHPSFSAPGKWSPAEYNPEIIDVETFDLMRRDSQLAIGLSLIKLPIQSLPWQVQCEDEDVKKTVEWALKKVWKDLMKSTLLAVDYGFSSHEKVWERGEVKISSVNREGKEQVHHKGDLVWFKKIKPHHPATIKMVFDETQNLIEVHQEATGMGKQVELPVRKVFLFTHDKEFGNPFGVSRLKNAYKVWYWKELLYQFMMQYFERRGVPPTIGTAPPGKSTDSSGAQIDNLELSLRMASSLVSSSIAVVPYQANKETGENMWKLEILKDDARGPMFTDALNHLDVRCLRALFIPESIASQSGGGFAAASVHADLFLMSEKGLIEDVEEAIDTQLVVPFIEANYPPEKRKECHVKLDPLDWNRKIALKEIFIEMLRNLDTMVQMGVPPKNVPSINKVAELLEIPIESFEEATGVKPEEMQEMIKATSQQQGGGGDPNDPEGKKGSPGESNKGKAAKVAGRKNTRGQSVDQTSDRKRINPGGRRADRNRESDTTKKR